MPSNQPPTQAPTLARKLTNEERSKLTNKAVAQYRKGDSIREIAKATGRGYGTIHKLLKEEGVQFRGRGGPRPRRGRSTGTARR